MSAPSSARRASPGRPRALRLAVLSDQHIDTEVAEESWELARAAFRAADRARVDHVVLAGDLFDCATAMARDRDVVERYLRRLGLWHRDRLTIVVGNHDIFRTPHHGSWWHRHTEYAIAVTPWSDPQEHYDAFTAWAGQLARPADRLADDDLYPLEKHLGHATLWAADTTAASAPYGGNGYWRKADDALLREAMGRARLRRILAIHHPPYEDDEQALHKLPLGDISLGFPAADYRRLRRFVADAQVDATVCGHVHAIDDPDDPDPWTWQVGGRAWWSNVHLVGRTGGVHGATPTFGILSIPPGDAHPSWEEVTF